MSSEHVGCWNSWPINRIPPVQHTCTVSSPANYPPEGITLICSASHANIISTGTKSLLCIYCAWKSLSLFATFHTNDLQYSSQLFCNSPTSNANKSLHFNRFPKGSDYFLLKTFDFCQKNLDLIKSNFEENFTLGEGFFGVRLSLMHYCCKPLFFVSCCILTITPYV